MEDLYSFCLIEKFNVILSLNVTSGFTMYRPGMHFVCAIRVSSLRTFMVCTRALVSVQSVRRYQLLLVSSETEVIIPWNYIAVIETPIIPSSPLSTHRYFQSHHVRDTSYIETRLWNCAHARPPWPTGLISSHQISRICTTNWNSE